MPREFSRKLRVAAELHRLLNELLLSEVKDPRLDGVRVNDVELSGDLGVAKVLFGTVDVDRDPRAAEEAFRKASGFLRTRVARALRLRRAPELRFVHDTRTQRGFELSRLIDDASATDARKSVSDEPPDDAE
jgi:ribosome-binding factor A